MSHFFFFFNDTATTEIYTLPYTTLFRSNGFVYWESRSSPWSPPRRDRRRRRLNGRIRRPAGPRRGLRSEEHTSELQSRLHLVCRLLLEKKKTNEFDSCARSDE